MADRIRCPHCEKTFSDEWAVFSHHRMKHHGREARDWRIKNKPVREREPSIADEHVEAMLVAACGEEIAEHIAMMFPDDFDEVRRRREEARAQASP